MIVTKSALSEEDNYLGYTDLGDQNVDGISDPILLTRVAARIDLVNVSTRFAGTPFAGREVRIDAVGIYNMKTKSYYFSEAVGERQRLPMPCEIRRIPRSRICW